jgi:hypothetical protein
VSDTLLEQLERPLELYAVRLERRDDLVEAA